jgi:transcriptional regulator with XRE-family HTH domain
MATEFGKLLRIIRVERGEILKHMSDRLNISPAYLSAIENGRREIPSDFIEKIVAEYNLEKEEEIKLHNVAILETKSMRTELADANSAQKQAFSLFARSLSELNAEDLTKISKIIRKERSDPI